MEGLRRSRLHRLRRIPGVAWATGAAAIVLWPWPVVQVLHVESAAVISLVGFAAAGQGAIGAFRRGERTMSVLARSVAALLVPWLLLTVSLAWAPNRDYARGALLWWTATVPAVAFGVALARALVGRGVQRARTAHVALGLVAALAGPAFDVGLHPQVYTYNHVWGGLLGPIYDLDLAVRPGLWAYRALTLAWAAWLVAVGAQRWTRGRQATVVALSVGIALVYAFRGDVGINTTYAVLDRALGDDGRSVARAPHAVVVGRGVDANEVEYRLADLAVRLGAWPSEPVHVYVYPDVETKRQLIGAGETSVAPVWLARPQVHVVASASDAHLAHELVHAVSREFGLPWIRASRRVGLVEGLAVAFEPPDGGPSPAALVSAAEVGRMDVGVARRGGDPAEVLARRLAATLGAGGFWTGRGAVSYTTTGAFVRWLADTHGAAAVRRAYAWGDVAGATGVPLDTLALRWARHTLTGIDAVPLAAAPVARASFSAPSLFERPSPHWVPDEVRVLAAVDAALARGDTAGATAGLRRLLARVPRFAPALDRHARIALVRAADGAPGGLTDALGRLRAANLPALDVRLGDLWAATGVPDSARVRYRAARRRLPLSSHASAAALWRRDALAADPALVRRLYGPPDPADAAFGPVLPCGAPPPPRIAAPRPDSLPGLAARLDAIDAARAGRCDLAAARFDALGDRDAAAFWRDRAALARWSARPSR